jgi:hypothetical protein
MSIALNWYQYFNSLTPNYININGSNNMTGNLNFNNNQSINLMNGINAQDLLTKNYIDTKYTILIGSLVNQTATGSSGINIPLSSSINNTAKVTINTFTNNFTNYNSMSYIVHYTPTINWSLYGFGNSSNYPFGNINSIPSVGIAFGWNSTSSIAIRCTLLNGATGYSIYIYN